MIGARQDRKRHSEIRIAFECIVSRIDNLGMRIFQLYKLIWPPMESPPTSGREIVLENVHKLFSAEVGNATALRKIYDIDSDVPANHVPPMWHRYAEGQRHLFRIIIAR